jgi:hypothetical protein
LKVEQVESQLAQLWDGFKMRPLIGAILNHIDTISEALLSFEIAEGRFRAAD